MRVELTAEAAADLKDIQAYSRATWGPAQTGVYMGALRRAIARLRTDHGQGRRRPELQLSVELRTVTRGRHVVYYAVAAERILVVRVLHDGMDPARHLRRP